MKKFFIMIMSLALCCFLLPTPISAKTHNTLKYEENIDLNFEQISARFRELSEKYDIGEPFNEIDTEFVKYYAQPANSLTRESQMQSFDVSRTSNVVTCNLYGSVTSTVNVVNHSFRGDLKLNINKGYQLITSLSLHTTNQTFGFIGNSGTYIGLVYSGDKETVLTPGQKTYIIDKTYNYSAVLVAYTHTNAYAEINTKEGGFTLYAF